MSVEENDETEESKLFGYEIGAMVLWIANILKRIVKREVPKKFNKRDPSFYEFNDR